MSVVGRRTFFGAAALSAIGAKAGQAQEPQARMNNLKIRDVRAIVTQPTARLIVVKIETTEPELYGLGCATFAYHPTAVAAAVNDYLRPFLLGKNPADIEDIWQSCYVSAYWRNGPVLGNALSGVDQALWDIKGKVAGMPVYDLFGGKAREAAACYVVPGGRTHREVEDNIRAFMARKFRYMKLSVSSAIPASEGPAIVTKKIAIDPKLGAGESDNGSIYEPRPYIRRVLDLFEHVRSTIGKHVELVYDVHERFPAIDALGFAKDVEQYKPFFIEDLFSPEDNEYFRLVFGLDGLAIGVHRQAPFVNRFQQTGPFVFVYFNRGGNHIMSHSSGLRMHGSLLSETEHTEITEKSSQLSLLSPVRSMALPQNDEAICESFLSGAEAVARWPPTPHEQILPVLRAACREARGVFALAVACGIILALHLAFLVTPISRRTHATQRQSSDRHGSGSRDR